MLIDELVMLRGDGSSPRVDATEDGSTSLTRDAGTGKAVVQINKTPKKGIPIVVVHDADTNSPTSNDREIVVTIEAADELDFNVTDELVATFPAVTFGASAGLMVRRIHTDKKYIRSVLTASGSNNTISVDFLIFAGIGLMNRG